MNFSIRIFLPYQSALRNPDLVHHLTKGGSDRQRNQPERSFFGRKKISTRPVKDTSTIGIAEMSMTPRPDLAGIMALCSSSSLASISHSTQK
jgi:hypothetical protein